MSKYPVFTVDHFGCHSKDGELYLNTLEEHLQTHRFIDEPHRHDSFLLVFFTHGSGLHEVDFDAFKVAPGSLFLLQPGQMHHWELSRDAKGFIAIWPKETLDLYFRRKQTEDYPFFSGMSTPEILFSQSETNAVLPYFKILINENKATLPYRTDFLINVLDCILMCIARKYAGTRDHQGHTYNVKIRQFEKLVESHFTKSKSASFYAEKLHITLKHLNRICREILQKTATEVITERIILEARRMLTDRSLNITEVADRLGYEDYSYFSRVFKKHAGASPSGFRRKMDPGRFKV